MTIRRPPCEELYATFGDETGGTVACCGFGGGVEGGLGEDGEEAERGLVELGDGGCAEHDAREEGEEGAEEGYEDTTVRVCFGAGLHAWRAVVGKQERRWECQ